MAPGEELGEWQVAIEEVRELLEKALIILTKLPPRKEEGIPDWARPRIRLWVTMYALGGTLSGDAVRKIWTEIIGQDPRGLGGFFVGKRASLTRNSAGDVVLTESAAIQAKEITNKTLAELMSDFKDDISKAKVLMGKL
ncbi:MAG: hypothetical protein QW491_13535 [Thermoproteota archaeon]